MSWQSPRHSRTLSRKRVATTEPDARLEGLSALTEFSSALRPLRPIARRLIEGVESHDVLFTCEALDSAMAAYEALAAMLGSCFNQ